MVDAVQAFAGTSPPSSYLAKNMLLSSTWNTRVVYLALSSSFLTWVARSATDCLFALQLLQITEPVEIPLSTRASASLEALLLPTTKKESPPPAGADTCFLDVQGSSSMSRASLIFRSLMRDWIILLSCSSDVGEEAFGNALLLPMAQIFSSWEPDMSAFTLIRLLKSTWGLLRHGHGFQSLLIGCFEEQLILDPHSCPLLKDLYVPDRSRRLCSAQQQGGAVET